LGRNLVCPGHQANRLFYNEKNYDHDIPFTNNEAERDLRVTKVHLKITGGFRTEDGAKGYALWRSYIQTMKKQGLCVLEGLTNLFIPNKNKILEQIFYRKTA
jgi:hypothetical protein